ncbi:hypothetical protein RHMOL_Rhmol13G0208100 [Rhododendron molle]|uniref:Uncharacterized protein n=1 Tax=Rhododendron molle TaxID=49168 RepID=A0ACC0L8R8_RHOML|nr:hypothetical protein RHMOL_Rhmol13G0208100 [Rhododendron molle]
MFTKNQLDQILLSAHVELDELYAVNVSDCRTDAGKTLPKIAQHAMQHEAAQDAPLVLLLIYQDSTLVQIQAKFMKKTKKQNYKMYYYKGPQDKHFILKVSVTNKM